jgi:glycosyltransferase involved in cell wall biosynthesis
MTLVHAVERMRNRDRAGILFIGHGELRDELEQYAARHGVRAVFTGFVNQSTLPRQYAIGDVFVLPSTYEPRGLVVNEAMAVGLPVIASDRVGAIGDLVRDVFPAGDAAALAEKLDSVADDPAVRERMSAWSREKISTWTYDAGVAGVKEALRSCR